MLAKIPGAVASALALCVAGAVSVPQGAMASGFALPEVSAAGVGMANALVANPKEVGAFAYNPAGGD